MISKTSFKAFSQCSAWFWFLQNKPEVLATPSIGDFDRMLIEQGKKVEETFYSLYPEVKFVGVLGMDAIDITHRLISEQTRYIAQAAFHSDPFFAQSDLIHVKEDGHLDIYEIKSSSSMQNMSQEDAPASSSKDEHVKDLTFQYLVATQSGYIVDHLYLVELNGDYKRKSNLDLRELFHLQEVTSHVTKQSGLVHNQMLEAAYTSAKPEAPTTCSCRFLPRKNQCAAFPYLHPELSEYAVYDLVRIGSSPKRLKSLIDSGIYFIRDVPKDYDLLDSHRDQVNTWISQQPIIQRHEIQRELDKLVYPLYFLDYETTGPAVPVFPNTKPYMHIPFQYSLHVLSSPNGEIIHKEYVHDENSDPTPALSKKLREDIGPTGTIIVWNKAFESKCHQNMAGIVFPLKDFLYGLNNRMYDLMEIFSKRLYVDGQFKGSSSIKKVLPVLVPQLSYADLPIADGGTATTQWSAMIHDVRDENEKARIKSELLAYCKMDTWAMVEIFKALVAL